jgi:23S rRNA (uracil1939-C5)-methyltransferase
MNKPRKNELVRVKIDALAFGGKGVGKLNGYVVFVEGGMPGDIAEVRIFSSRARFAEGRIENLAF